jgi:outer membrane protein insertion porin family
MKPKRKISFKTHRISPVFFFLPALLFLLGSFWEPRTAIAQEKEEAAPIIGNVEISGNKMVSTALVKKQLRSQKGKPFSRIDINKDIKRLYELNWFSKISVDVEEGKELKVIFTVIEKPTIGHIVFKGNSKIKNSALKKKLTEKEGDLVKFSVAEGDLLNEKSISDAAAALKSFYEKKGYKAVQVKTELVNDEKENKTDVLFHIDEGNKIKIKRIHIIGAVQLKEKKILKEMQTKRKRWYNSGIYEEDKFQEDLERIKAFYYKKGFIDIRILGVKQTLVQNDKKVVIDIEISEGKQYKVGSVEIEGQKSFIKEEIIKGTLLKTGDIYLPENLGKDMKTVKDFYFSRGYIDAKIGVDTFAADQPDTLNIKYSVMENEIVFVDKIKIQGNERTKDIVIRRELNIKPGDKFDGVKMEVAQKRLSNTGLFNDDKGVPKVDLYPDPSSKDLQRDLIVEVQEGKSGELSFGAGYSSVESLVGFLEVSQGNFDIFNWPSFTGDAQKLKLRTEFGQYTKSFLIDFTEPWLFEKRLLFGVQLFNSSNSYSGSDYTEDKQGFLLRLAKPVFKYTRAEVNYSYQTVDVEGVSDTASEYLKSQEGKRDVGKIGLDLVRDVRDSFYNATKGSRLEWSMDVAGVGGNTDYYRSVFDGDLYFGLWFNHVLVTSFRMGAIEGYGSTGDDVPIFARFFLGGSRSVRGFDYRDLGPHDKNGEPLGGKFEYNGTFEYVIPIIEQFRLGLFFDYGNLYADFNDIDLGVINGSVGIGLQIQLPIGPLRFDYGIPVVTDDYHEGESGKFTFDIGNRF